MPDIGSTSACWDRGPEGSADAAERLATEGRRRVAAFTGPVHVCPFLALDMGCVVERVWLVALLYQDGDCSSG